MGRGFIILVMAALVVGCSKKDPTLENVGGSEPRRLSFGEPQAVQATFLEKMRFCWFTAEKAPLQGYRFETVTTTQETPGTTSEPVAVIQNIKIYDEAKQAEAFEVQFHKYNENTLISTRNLGLPIELASRLKRDLETWILRTSDCE